MGMAMGILGLSLAGMGPVRQNVYYLDPSHGSASDSNAGTSPNAPFATVAAIDGSFPAGSTIYIRAGLTYTEELTITAVGTASKPITFTSYGAGNKPLFTAPGNSAITLTGAQYVVVDGLGATSAVRGGVTIDAASNNYTIKNCEVYDCGLGVETYGPYGLFQSNLIRDLVMVFNTPGGFDDYGAVAFTIMETSNIECADNTILRCLAPSFDYTNDGGAFETWKTCSNIWIHHNHIEDTNGFLECGGESGDTVSGILIEHNLCIDNNSQFAWLHNGGGAFAITITGTVEFRYNTVVERAAAPATTLWGFGAPPGMEVYSHHNIFDCNQGYVFLYTTAFPNRHDNTYHGPLWVLGDDTNTLLTNEDQSDPMFVSSSDFHLQPGSPAAGRGAYA